ncbi:type II toxin-antitoxin system toxin ribonuclease C26 [soil metagenome]
MERPLITLDTSGLYALINRADPDHEAAAATFFEDTGPYLVPAGILAEISYLIERRLGTEVLDSFIEDLTSGAMSLECGEVDLPRIRELVRRYSDLPLGFADACVIACTERASDGRVLTLDRRHFDVVAREGNITPLPEI